MEETAFSAPLPREHFSYALHLTLLLAVVIFPLKRIIPDISHHAPSAGSSDINDSIDNKCYLVGVSQVLNSCIFSGGNRIFGLVPQLERERMISYKLGSTGAWLRSPQRPGGGPEPGLPSCGEADVSGMGVKLVMLKACVSSAWSSSKLRTQAQHSPKGRFL